MDGTANPKRQAPARPGLVFPAPLGSSWAIGIATVVLGALALSCQPPSSAGYPIQVMYSLIGSNTNRVVIRIAIQNCSRERLTISNMELPWYVKEPHTILACVVQDPFGTALRRFPPFGHPPVGEERLVPGQTLAREEYLDALFPDLPEQLKRQDCVLFWRYDPKTIAGRPMQPVGGWLQIPKHGNVKD